jgi:tetratricopeptide (TPR) repeat protein
MIGRNLADFVAARSRKPQNFYMRPLDLNRRVRKDKGSSMPVKSSTRKKLSRAGQRDLDTKIDFMEGLLRRDPEYVDALQLLGDHYTQRGRYLDGLKVDERLARLEPRNALVYYNLACSYSLTEQFDRAAFALEQALNLGYRDFNWLAKDPDLRKLRQQPVYRDIQTKIRRMKIKVC